MKRRLTVAALVCALSGAWARADVVDKVGEPAAEIAAARWWNGTQPRLETLRGKVLVVQVSDPAQGGTKGRAKAFGDLVDRFQPQGVSFAEVLETDTEATVMAYLTSGTPEVKWPVAWDSTGTFASAYAGTLLPRTYVVGPDGRVAWQGPSGSLTTDLLDAEVARRAFFDAKAIPDKAKAAAKAIVEQRFGDAATLAAKVQADGLAPVEAKNLCARIAKEAERVYDLRKKAVEASLKEGDLAIASRRLERMRACWKRSPHEAEIEAKWAELSANGKVAEALARQKELEEHVAGLSVMAPHDLEKAVAWLEEFQRAQAGTPAAVKAADWIAEAKRLAARRAAKK